ncbi:hypothetical protein QF027_007461 [Streptomyces canus]|nr:hypothetical protein [Streptomyces canus]
MAKQNVAEQFVDPKQMPRLLQTAIQNAVGRSGVSVVTLPGDIADQPAPDKAAETALVTSRPSVRPGDAEIDKLVEMIDKADRGPPYSTNSPTTTPCSPSTPACAMCGPPVTSRPTAAAA